MLNINNIFKKSCALLSILIAAHLLPINAKAQVNLSNGSPTYTQNFDGLGSSTVTWSDNSTLIGWYANSSNLSNIVAGSGSSNTGAVYNFGNTVDRALGSLASGSTNTLNFGVRLVNTGTGNITSLAISYTGEQWRCGGNTTPHTNTFSYAVNPSSIISGSYVNESALDFTGPVALSGAAALDGNAGANRTAKSFTITGLGIPPGGAVWLRFTDINDGGSDHGLSIDDMTVTATFSAATVNDYYSGPTGNLDDVNSWWSDAGGTTGTHPANFTDAGKTFHISNGTAGNIAGSNWTVSGSGSKVIVDGTDLTIQATASITATIDVNASRKLTIKHTTLPTLGALNATSTVMYSGITFTSTFVVPSAATYGNIIFDNSIVVNTPTTQTLLFAGDFILQNSSSFTGSDVSANGYNLTTTGTANQTINANGLPFQIRGLNNNNTVAKTGMLTLAPNTDISIWNSIIMNCSGTANMFSDGGNTLTLYNNVSLGGNAAGYNLTGTIIPSLASGTAKFRGFVGSAASDAAPVAAALNNVIINTSGSGGSAFLPTSGATITIKGNLTITSSGSGNLVLNANTIQIGGNLTHTPTANFITATGSTIQFNGTGTQTYSSNVAGGNTLVNVTMNNSGAGLTLSAPLNISGVLTLTNGKITTGANVLSLTAAGTTSGGNSNSYVNGNFLKTMPSGGTTTMAYEVGDATYAPILLTFGSSVSSGSVTVAAKAGPHPQISSSYINTGNFVNRYWSVTNAGVAAPSVDIALSYSSGDMTGTPNTGYVTRMYDGMEWATTPGTTNTTSASAPLLANASTGTGISGGTFSGDYIAGQLYCPTAITGTLNVCETSTVTLGNSISGGVWSSSNSNVTIGSASGVVNGVSAGTSVITYMLNTGCQTMATATVNPLPAGIAGASEVCVGSSTILSSPGSGAWSTSNGNVTIGSATGVTTGVSAGISTITYTLPTGCLTTKGMTINALPSPISGPTDVCEGSAITLSNSGGGTWSSSNGDVNIGSASGLLTGVTAGTSTISYTLPTGCFTTIVFTVNQLPSAITGATLFCQGTTTALADAISGGSWSSSNSGVATAGTTTGIVSGVAGGNADITYTLPTGCLTMTTVTVNTAPDASNFTSPAATDICEGGVSAITINSTSLGTATFTATYDLSGANTASGNTASVSMGASSGAFSTTALSAAGPTTMTVTSITNVFGCVTNLSGSNVVTFTVNPLPAAISGPAFVCAGSATTLTSSGTGVWSSDNVSLATVGSGTGIVSGIMAGAANISYVLPTGCSVAKVFTVNSLPATITGANTVCVGASASLNSTTSGGTWSSSNPSEATVNSSGIVSGVAAGMPTITYTLPTGCIAIKGITVNPLPVAPASITGLGSVCAGGSVVTLSSATPGGVWSSAVSLIASVGTTGVVTGINAGMTIISYTLSNSCGNAASTFLLTVNPLPAVPAAISGPSSICTGSVISLSSATPGGAWSSSTPAIATISSSGIVSGITPGVDTIRYAITNSCGSAGITKLVIVNPSPVVGAISGPSHVCTGAPIILSATPAGGTWASSGIYASVAGGYVMGVVAGVDTIKYSLSNSCGTVTSAKVVSVDATPNAGTITGSSKVCVGSSTILFNPVAGGTWTVTNPAASVSSGLVTGLVAGIDTIRYTMPGACGAYSAVMKIITVNALPNSYSLTGGGNYCSGGVGVHIGLNGSQATDRYQLYKGMTITGSPITGTGSAIDFGLRTDTGTYTVVADNPATGCSRTMTGSPQIGFNTVTLPEVTIYTSSVPDIQVGEILTFTAIVTNGMTAYSYTWQVGSTYVADTSHTYVTNRHMLFDNDVITCTIKSYGICGEVYGSKSVTVNLHNVGVNEPGRNGNSLGIYPSPSNGAFTVKGNIGSASNEEVNMQITDLSGRVVHTASFIANNGAVNEHVQLSDAVSNGVYILNLHRGAERKTLRLVVAR